MVIEIAPDTAGRYLKKHGVVPDDAITDGCALAGGVSNRVIQIEWERGCLVVKQPLANLDVEEEWSADVTRVHNEAAALRAWSTILSDAGVARVSIPDVVYESRRDNVVAMECAHGTETWKSRLLEGIVEIDTASTVGEALGTVHRAAADDPDLAATFESGRPFEQLRLDPYHRTTADRHPEVREVILAEIERVTSVRRTLIHGDYSPKNVLVERVNRERVIWVIDFEVAHWGDPGFDVAFMLNHLLIKSVYNADRYEAYTSAARAFYAAYEDASGWDVERDAVSELAVLMLARVDGKSPVEYVSEGPVATALRTIAKRALREQVRTLDGYLTIMDEERDPL